MSDRLYHVLATGLERREKLAHEGARRGARERAEEDSAVTEPTAAPPAILPPRFIAPAVQPAVVGSKSPGKGQLAPPKGTAPVLLHRPTRSLNSSVVSIHPSPRGTAMT